MDLRRLRDELRLGPILVAGVAAMWSVLAAELWPTVTWGLVTYGAVGGLAATVPFALLHAPLAKWRQDRCGRSRAARGRTTR